MQTEIQRIVAEIIATYGSLSDPQYHFVSRVVDERPYRELEDALRGLGTMAETTDVNDDVSFNFSIQSGGEHWGIALSMVGPYAVVWGGPTGINGVVSPHERAPTGFSGRLLEVLTAHGIEVLPERVVTSPLEFSGSAVDAEDATLFQALFTDTDVLPWEPE
jgi:hypothetical protein